MWKTEQRRNQDFPGETVDLTGGSTWLLDQTVLLTHTFHQARVSGTGWFQWKMVTHARGFPGETDGMTHFYILPIPDRYPAKLRRAEALTGGSVPGVD